MVVAELQRAEAVRAARPDRQAPERRAAVLARVHKAALEHRAASVRMADSIMGSELGASRAKAPRISKAKATSKVEAMQAIKETKTHKVVCKMGSHGAEVLAHELKIRNALRIRNKIRPHAAARGPGLGPACPQATLATASTATHKAVKQEVAIQLVPASMDSRTT